jgi:hypothetical protein
MMSDPRYAALFAAHCKSKVFFINLIKMVMCNLTEEMQKGTDLMKMKMIRALINT